MIPQALLEFDLPHTKNIYIVWMWNQHCRKLGGLYRKTKAKQARADEFGYNSKDHSRAVDHTLQYSTRNHVIT